MEAYKELKREYKEPNRQFLEKTRGMMQDLVARLNLLRDWFDDDDSEVLLVLAVLLLEKFEEYLSKIADY